MNFEKSEGEIVFRAGSVEDAEGIADVYIDSRNTFLPYAPMAHTELQVRVWIAEHLIPECEITVVERRSVAGEGIEIVGVMALYRRREIGWLDQLFLAPSVVGQGIGTQLVARAKAELGAPIHLYTFQQNAGARRFYERHGFRAIQFGDGSGNEEGCPDVLYEWTGDPVVGG